MAYPSLTFANLLEQATRAELEQFISLLQGYLSQQHDENGAHTDITADSVTVSGNVSAGDGTFTGNVMADSDGQVTEIGGMGSGFGGGVDMLDGTESHWQITAVDGGVSPRNHLRVRDMLRLTTDRLFDIASYSGGSGAVNYSLVPETTTGFSLGENSSGKRIDEVNAKTLRSSVASYAAILSLTSRTAPAITSTVDDYAINGQGRVLFTLDAAHDMTGIVAGHDGEVLVLSNNSGFTLTLKHQNGSSAAGNRLVCPALSDFALRGGGSVMVQYDTTTGVWWVFGA